MHAQIFSRDIGSYNIVAKRKGYLKTITVTLTLAIIPTLIPTLTLTQVVARAKYSFHWPVTWPKHKTVFAHNFSGKHFYPMSMCGDSESANKIATRYFQNIKNLAERFTYMFYPYVCTSVDE